MIYKSKKGMDLLAEVLGSLYAAFSGEQKPETHSPHWYRGYLTAINDVSKIVLHKDLERLTAAEFAARHFRD